MAYASSLRHPATFAGLRDRIAGKFREIRARREQYQDYFQTVDALSRATDAQLSDLGIRRDEIEGIARHRAGL